MFDIEEITQKWYELGFLKQLSEHLKPIVALKYELTAHCLIDNDDYLNNNILNQSIFPIIHRIYNQGKTISNVETFVRQVHVFFVNNCETIQDLSAFSNIDVEGEMCALFVEQWESEKVIEPIKWINKHKL